MTPNYFQSTFNSVVMCVSPGQVFSHCLIGTCDKGGRVCARCVRLRCHGKSPQTNSPQQLEHKNTQEHRLGKSKGRGGREWTTTNYRVLTCSKQINEQEQVQWMWYVRDIYMQCGASMKETRSPQSKLSRIHLAVSLHWAVQFAYSEPTYSIHTIIAAT